MTRPDPLGRLVEQLQRLPGIGAKSAQRLAFHILKTPREEVDRLADAMRDVKDRVTYCSICSNITDVDPCYFCTHAGRDHRVICVVEEPENVMQADQTVRLDPTVQGEASSDKTQKGATWGLDRVDQRIFARHEVPLQPDR